MSKKAGARARMETLDGDFNVCEYIATSDGTSSVIPDDSVRVTFGNGAMIDVYLDRDDQLMIVGCRREGYADEVLLTGGGNEAVDFVVTARSTKSR